MPITSAQSKVYWDDPVRSSAQRESLRLSKLGENNPMKQPSAQAKSSKSHIGQKAWNKGKPHLSIKGSKHWNWKGGLIVERGYRYIYTPNHPHKNSKGYVLEHRLAMEKVLGRYLESSEVVHHIDHTRTNNIPENLVLMSDSEHKRLEAKYRNTRE
jgi:hypothetical protein